ncbi:claudin-10 isoform X4 [Sparus aurata]|uniref:claudin-10 isoform X4 n=1 Tax=Sparus aurata TaxID=8175 RepID=UPI0011C11993|nr:claudin-10-like isoform X4 [Sparus aurata]
MSRTLAQILGLLLCILGWSFVGSTLAFGHWRVAQLEDRGGSPIVATPWYWSDLWKDCYDNTQSVVNCVNFMVLWEVKSHIQAVQGLLIVGLCLGLIGIVLTFPGLECTNIGGGRRSKDRMLITAAALHLVGCASGMAAYCLYINRVVGAILHREADPSKLSYEMGPALYLGLVASFLIILGCAVHCATACSGNHPKRQPVDPFICEKGEEKELSSGRKDICGPAKISRNVSPYKMASVVTV